MLVGGYDRTVPVPYFMCKNRWRGTNGVDGYRYSNSGPIRRDRDPDTERWPANRPMPVSW